MRRFAEIQGGWIKAEALDGGGAAFRVFLPDGAGTGGAAPALQITVDEPEPEREAEPDGEVWEAEAAHQTLAAELRRVALQGDQKR